MIPLPIYLGILLELVFVSWKDIKTKKISNYWSIANILIFVILTFVLPEYYFWSWQTFLYSGVFLLIGFALFLLNIMGGGDSKFLFSFFLLIPMNLQEQSFFYLLVSTVVTGLMFFMMNFITHFKDLIRYLKIGDYKGVKSCFGSKFAFAPVILLAWLCVGWFLRKNF